MKSQNMSPRSDAETIWKAGVTAVDSARLVRAAVKRGESTLDVCGEQFDLASLGRLIVVGAGKAGAGMAWGLEEALGEELLDTRVEGWINVPAACARHSVRESWHRTG